ncbi:hypothetical protein BHE74_00059371 [Ensete ventricosum]|nr:hypothetical protein GW17_00024667 [Ensete ventricosum]RWW35672.1 hypothetical protein BHE74_00059371 [Ensete ventricosum]RZS25811.1 hypothetical protein BHM03_00059082 [Ensete ventricosum]
MDSNNLHSCLDSRAGQQHFGAEPPSPASKDAVQQGVEEVTGRPDRITLSPSPSHSLISCAPARNVDLPQAKTKTIGVSLALALAHRHRHFLRPMTLPVTPALLLHARAVAPRSAMLRHPNRPTTCAGGSGSRSFGAGPRVRAVGSGYPARGWWSRATGQDHRTAGPTGGRVRGRTHVRPPTTTRVPAASPAIIMAVGNITRDHDARGRSPSYPRRPRIKSNLPCRSTGRFR